MMKTFRKLLCIVLAVSMAVSLCACGSKGKGDSQSGSTDAEKQNTSTDSIAKQFVYSMEHEFDFSQLQGATSDISAMCLEKAGDRIYAILQGNGYQGNGMAAYTYILAEVDPDTGDVKLRMMDAPVEKRAVSADDSAYSNTYENTMYSNFKMSADGKIYGSKSYDYSDYTNIENVENEHSESICCWDLNGEMLWEAKLNVPGDGQSGWYYTNGFAIQQDGSVYVLMGGDDNGIVKVSADGNAEPMTSTGALGNMLDNYSGIASMPDGKLLITYYDDQWQNVYINTYDFAADQTGEAVKLPSTVAYSLSGRFVTDAKGDVVYSTSEGVFKYHIGAEREEEIMSFVNSDLYVTGFDVILALDDSSFAACFSEFDSTDYSRSIHGGLFTKVDPKDIPDKKVLVLGGSYLYGDLQKRVVDFNKASQEYRIVMKDYSQYNTYDDYTLCYTQLNNDIISGNMPDILVVDSYNMPLENYVNKGLLADIDELIQKDAELSKVEFMDNFFEACRINGRLYEVVPSFSMHTYIAKKSLVGEHNIWTMKDAMKLMESLPEGTNLFSDMTREQFMNSVMEVTGSQLVDISTGKCSFDSEAFIDYMKFAKSLPEELGDNYYSDDWYTTYESQYRENRTVLDVCYLSSIEDLIYTINGKFGEDVSLIGFPGTGEAGSGGVIYTNTSYALAAGSPNLDAAWNFVRYYLTDEYQETVEWQLPASRQYLERNAQKATQKQVYMVDGQPVEEDYHYWINNEMMDIEPLSQSQVKEIVDYIASVKTRAYYNAAVINIVGEELGAFYKNQKSAEDVASLIQNRVQLYINENR
ncbi:MAG: extracellular solute-binding protein [Lachnospiraceae bacterium]|nr:extracellular solute-binding protein [Lachnospiraceae bacterium]